MRLALHHGCTVYEYTTIGKQEKHSHIGNSRDESFEQMICSETIGKGVDMVLNSLSDENLIPSVKCLAGGGRFIEIGKFDLLNVSLNLLFLQREASFIRTILDQLFTDSPTNQIIFRNMLNDGIENGSIKPLNMTIFKYNEVEQAFRFMAKGQHMGKILIQIRDPEKDLNLVPTIKNLLGISRYSCNPEKTYLIVGGLGGSVMELTDWLVLRRAKRLVLTSRKGISTGYQSHGIGTWRSYGILIDISTADVTAKEGCKQLIEQFMVLGPIEAIFNLAVVLFDAIFENQTPETFTTAFKPKALATKYLDELTREMCPDLGEFVIFSSVSCGRGNAGQTNYGMVNSVMERICEKRKQDGYPALAIEWGAVGVGLVAEMQEEHTELEISGTLQQPISSCLKVLDTLLKHKSTTIVSSMVVAEYRAGARNTNNIVYMALDILGMPDIKAVSLHSILAELGMDSMTAVEIKQTLEIEFEVFLSAKDMGIMTLAGLKQIQEQKSKDNAIEEKENDVSNVGLDMVLRLVGEESESCILNIRLTSAIDESTAGPKVLLFPGIEGIAKSFQPLARHLKAHVIGYGIQFTYGTTQANTATEMAEILIPFVEQYLEQNKQFTILAHFYGAVIALEVVHILESRGYVGTIMCLHGARFLLKQILASLRAESEHTFQNVLIRKLLALVSPTELTSQQKKYLFNCKSWEDRVNYAVDIAKDTSVHNKDYLTLLIHGIYYRLKAVLYTSSYTKLKSTIKLFKPKQSIVHSPGDYELSQVSEQPVEVKIVEGSHFGLLQNEESAKIEKLAK